MPLLQSCLLNYFVKRFYPARLIHPVRLTIFPLFLICSRNYFPSFRKQQKKRNQLFNYQLKNYNPIFFFYVFFNISNFDGSTAINKQYFIRLQPCLLNLLSTEKFPCSLNSFESFPSCLLNRSCSLNYFLKIILPARSTWPARLTIF